MESAGGVSTIASGPPHGADTAGAPDAAAASLSSCLDASVAVEDLTVASVGADGVPDAGPLASAAFSQLRCSEGSSHLSNTPVASAPSCVDIPDACSGLALGSHGSGCVVEASAPSESGAPSSAKASEVPSAAGVSAHDPLVSSQLEHESGACMARCGAAPDASASNRCSVQDTSSSHVEGELDTFLVATHARFADFEKNFAGDKMTRCLFERAFFKMRFLGQMCLRGDDTRIEVVNEMLVPDLALRKVPLHSIRIEQSETADVKFFKCNLSGWYKELDRRAFEALAYGDAPVTENADESVHMLCIRGNALRCDGIPPQMLARFCIVVACDDVLHIQRIEAAAKRKEDSEKRASSMGLSGTETDPVDTTKTSQLEMQQPQLIVDRGTYVVDSIPRSDRHTMRSLTANSCFELLLSSAVENLGRIKEAFAWDLCRSGFAEKLEYWRGLRSSNATAQKLLTNIFDACLSGKAGEVFVDARELCRQYKWDYKGYSPGEIANKLVQWQSSLNLSTGFVTGFGGFLTMPVTIPTGLLATWITSTRLAFAIAHIYGHDMHHPCVTNAVLYCLTGSAPGAGEEPPEDGVRKELQACAEHRHGTPQLEDVNALPMQIMQRDVETDESPKADDMLALNLPGSEEFQSEYATLYDLIGVPHEATQQEIRVAYRRLALRHHPDKLPPDASHEQLRAATARFQVLGAAYEELADPERRRAYDARLRKGDWSWADFSWNLGLKRARTAFQSATSKLSEAICGEYHDIEGHAASRASIQVAVDVAESVSVGALRSSILAGEHLAASATARTTTRVIPIIGALFTGVVDCATTASVGRRSLRVFKA